MVHFVKLSDPRYISHLTNRLPIRVVQVFQVIVGLIKTSTESSHADGSQTEWHATYFSFNNMEPQELLTQVYCSEPQSTELPFNKKVAFNTRKTSKDFKHPQVQAAVRESQSIKSPASAASRTAPSKHQRTPCSDDVM